MISTDVTFVPLGSDSRYRDSVRPGLQSGPMEEAHLNGKIRVIVASTDTRLRKVLYSALIRDRRFDVVAQATDGDAVVSCVATFDVAIVDVAIAGLGILGVMSSLTNSVMKPVVIVVSCTDAIYLRHACLAEGAADYLVLPDDLLELPERVTKAVCTTPVEVVVEQ